MNLLEEFPYGQAQAQAQAVIMGSSAIEDKLSITMPSNLSKLVLERFEAAKASESIVFLESEVKIVSIHGIPVRINLHFSHSHFLNLSSS